MHRFTEVTVTPTIESTGIKTAFNSFMEENENWPVVLEDIVTGIAPPELFADFNAALQLLDPEFENPAKFKITFHTGRFVSTVDENLILPEFRDILVRKSTNWEDGIRITFDIENRGGGEKATKGEINMWNLSDGSLEVVKAGAILEVKSGYDFRNDYILVGVITEVLTEREGGDMRTKISCIGAVSPVLDLRTSFGPIDLNEPAEVMLSKWLGGHNAMIIGGNFAMQYPGIEEYGISISYVGFDGQSFKDISDKSGFYYFHGNVTYASGLNELREDFGIDWLVINKTLYILNIGTVLPLQIRLSFASGLISFNPTPKQSDDTLEPIDEVTVKSILIPNIFPKALIAIQPKVGEYDIREDKYYVITEVIYKSEGSTGDHTCEFKCLPASDWRTAVDLIEQQLDELEAEVSL